MRNLFYSFIFIISMASGAQAQIKLLGMAYNTSTNVMELIQWNAFDEASVSATPTILDSYLFASSSYDPFNGTYYIAGNAGVASGLFSYDTDSGESNLSGGALFSNIAEFDMSTGKMYNLTMATEEYISVYEYDILANEDSLIGTIYVPGVIGIVADAIGFDSNNGIIYYAGLAADNTLSLFAIPVREETFSYTIIPLNTPNPISSITSLNFDNTNEKLFALNDIYDANGNSEGRNIVEIDITTGNVITLTQLNEFPYFVGGSSQFDQNTGTFLLVGINTSNETKMIAFDTYTNTYETGFVPNVSEIVCDNKLFVRSRYLEASVKPTVSSDFNLYPNPAKDELNISFTTNGPRRVQIFNTLGALVYEAQSVTSNQVRLDVSALPTGIYTVQVNGGTSSLSRKLVVE